MNAYRNLSDSELATLINSQDKNALEEIYLRYWGILYQHALKILHDSNKAADIVQDLFTHLLCNMGNYQINTPIQFYLYRSIRNRVIDNFNHWQHQQKYLDSLKAMYQEGNYQTDETILENELKKRIESALHTLPAKMRQVFEMSRNTGMSHKEIAVNFHISEETVKAQVKKALKLLRKKLTALFF